MNNPDQIREAHQRQLEAEVFEAEKALLEAHSLLDKECVNTIKTLLFIRDNGSDDGHRLNAAKSLAKLHGLEVERHVFSDPKGNPIRIFLPEVKK